MLVVLAKMGAPEMVGQFVLGLAVTSPVIMFANLALRPVQATDARHEYLFSDYLALRLITTVLALLVIVGITFAVAYRWETALVILAVGLAKAIEAISNVFYGLLQQHERMDRIAKSMIIKGPLSLLAFSVGVYLTNNVLFGIAGLAIAWALILIGYDMRCGVLILNAGPRTSYSTKPRKVSWVGMLRPRWEVRRLRRLAWLALPLGVAMMLISLNANIPRYFVERYLGEQGLGFFAAMAYLMIVGGTMVNALGQSASPRLAKYYATKHGAAYCTLLTKLIGTGVLLGGAGVMVAIVAGRKILTLLYKPEYAAHTDVFVWLMVAATISYISSFLGYGMTASRYFRIQPVIFALSSLFSIILCLAFIPRFGMLGAAWTMVIIYCFQAIVAFLTNAHAIYGLHKTLNDTRRK